MYHEVMSCGKLKKIPEKESNYLKILNIGTDRSVSTVQTQISLLLQKEQSDKGLCSVQTQISLLLKEQSDQGLHCLPFHLHLVYTLLH